MALLGIHLANFMPPELFMFKEKKILEAIIKNSPHYILITERGTDEYGCHYFEKNYGQENLRVVRKNYSLISTLGAPPLTNSGLGIQIWKYHH
jgi:hypothetical protein